MSRSKLQQCCVRHAVRPMARRRSFMLSYFIGAFPMLLVGGSMVVYLLVQILAGLRVTSAATSDYATLSDLLSTLRIDSRSAVSAEFPRASATQAQGFQSLGVARRVGQALPDVADEMNALSGRSRPTELVLHSNDATIRYRFAGPRIVRSLQPTRGSMVEHVWNLKRILLSVSPTGRTGDPPTTVSTGASAGSSTRDPGVTIFHLTAQWAGDDRHALRPDRRFDTAYFVGRSYR